MNKEAKLILDNNAHKCSITVDGKQQKLTIAPYDEMSITKANDIIKEINHILNSDYTFKQMINLLGISERLPVISRYSPKSINIVIKLFHSNELQDYINTKQIDQENETTRQSLVILNIGCTSVGKTLGNLNSIISTQYVRPFVSSLTSIKESTNFQIQHIVNPIDKDLVDLEEYQIEVNIKSEKEIVENIKSSIIESIQETIDNIKIEAKSNSDNKDIWYKSIRVGINRLKVNKDKTFDITDSVTLVNESDDLEKIIIKSIKNYSTQSTSYNGKLSDEQIKDDIINDIKNDIFKLNVDDITHIACEIDEFKKLLSSIKKQLDMLLIKFYQKYDVQINYEDSISIKKKFSDECTPELISNIFGNKKQRKNEDFFSIDALILDAKIFYKNSDINNGNELKLVDGLGINQGQIPPGKEKEVAYNRVHSAIQQSNPDIILYNTRLDTKDDYMIDVIKDLNEQGYKNRVFVTYGRVDAILENYCDEEGIKLNDFSEKDLFAFEKYINLEYINKELISLDSLQKDKVYLCDKPCKLSKYSSEYYDRYNPKEILKNIIDVFRSSEKSEKTRLHEERVNKIIDIMDKHSIFNNTFNTFIDIIDQIVPMKYSDMRWNVLECGIKHLYYDYSGYASLYPSIALKNCFAKFLNCDEIKDILKEEYDNILKELLNQWTSLTHTIMITSYKLEFSKLLEMRYNPSLRTMTTMTMTDERKYILRNIFSTCFHHKPFSEAIVFKMLTRYVLSNIIY